MTTETDGEKRKGSRDVKRLSREIKRMSQSVSESYELGEKFDGMTLNELARLESRVATLRARLATAGVK